MYIAINIEEYNIHNLFLSESTKNTVIENSLFTRLFYSTENINLNGCFFVLNVNNYIDENKTQELLSRIHNIELDILLLYQHNILSNNQKIKKLMLRENINNQINNKYSKINEKKQIIIKISGIWEDYTEYGLTFKIINL